MVVDGDRDEEEVEEEIRLYWVLYFIWLCLSVRLISYLYPILEVEKVCG